MTTNFKSNQGFSLIELLVVVALIGVLSGIGLIAYNLYITASQKKITETNHTNLTKRVMTSMMVCDAGMELILNDENGKTKDQCDKMNEENLANFRTALVKHFQNGERWCSPYGQYQGGICVAAVIEGEDYEDFNNPSMPGVSKLIYGTNIAGKICQSIFIRTEILPSEYKESTICKP